jgi:hypothetical protein
MNQERNQILNYIQQFQTSGGFNNKGTLKRTNFHHLKVQISLEK